jgi:hypothetical protein
VWALRQWFVARAGFGLCVGCGTSMPEEDETLFAKMASQFEMLEPAI